jgi:2-oxoglutarate dehydrogenase E2 component (dihydrolipoamide succinyltransferase)
MDVVMPQLGETVAEGTVTRWHKQVGDAIRADEALFDVETDKVSTEIPAPVSGVVSEILVAEGTTAKVGARLAVIRESGTGPRPAPAAPVAARATAPSAPAARTGGSGRLSPVVSRLLGEHGLDARDITGTGRDGRITREDVLARIERRGAPVVRTEDKVPYTVDRAGAETVPLNGVRRRTAEHVAQSWRTVPHVLQAVEADFSGLDSVRRGADLTYLPFIARAVVRALAKYPRLNATFKGDHLELHRRVNLGIAVDLDFEGLLVPVVKDAQEKGVRALAQAIADLGARARANRLKPDDMTEGTYTITNNGAYGTLITAPIISAPQVAILSTDGVRKRPVVVEGDRIEARPVGVLAQSFDHRAVDGAYAASFLGEVRRIIETSDWADEVMA